MPYKYIDRIIVGIIEVGKNMHVRVFLVHGGNVNEPLQRRLLDRRK